MGSFACEALTGPVDAQSIAAVCEDLAAGSLGQRVAQSSFLADASHELGRDPLDRLQNRSPSSRVRNDCTSEEWDWRTHLLCVSSGDSKLFWRFSSSTRASFAASSEEVGSAIDIGGVTPHCRAFCAFCVDMLETVSDDCPLDGLNGPNLSSTFCKASVP